MDAVEMPVAADLGTKYEELDGHDLRRVQVRLPSAVLKCLQENPMARVAGGFVRAIVAGEEISDVDVFPGDVENAEIIARGIAGGFVKAVLDPGPSVVKTLHAFTIHVDPVIQVIHRWSAATPEALLNGFDFTIGAACVWWKDGLLRSLVHPRFYRDVAAKRLTFIDPIEGDEAGGSLLRLQKFARRGYRASAFQTARIVCALIEEGQKKNEGKHDEPLTRTVARLIREVDPSTQDGWEELTEAPGAAR